jgi:polyisoprenoid-binding protein YceI
MKLLALPFSIVLGVLGLGDRAGAAVRIYQLDVPHSRLVIRVHKSGAFAAALHDHAFVPGRWRGEVSFDADAPGLTQGTIVVDAASLRDEEQALSAADRAEVEAQARGPDVLDVAKYPEVRLEVNGVELGGTAQGAGTELVTLLGTLHLHGRSSPVRIPLAARFGPVAFDARGQARFRQSDFGIRPLSRLLGAIAVKDDVVVEIDVRGHVGPDGPSQPSP